MSLQTSGLLHAGSFASLRRRHWFFDTTSVKYRNFFYRCRQLLRGKLDLFYLADLSFSRSQRSELHNLREARLRETHSWLRQDLGYLQQASYCAALIEQTTETDTPLPLVFELMAGLLTHLPLRTAEPKTIFAFELKLLDQLGLSPALEKTKLNPGTRQILKALTESDWPRAGQLRPSDAQVKELNQFLHGFLIFHLGKISKGRNAALNIIT